MKKKVVIVSPRGRGGISAVVDVHLQHGLSEKFDIELITSHRSASLAGRLWIFLVAYVRFCTRLITGRVSVVHLHMACYGSFWRKSLFLLAARLVGVPTILHLHGGKFHLFYENLAAWARRVVRYVLDRASYIVVLSDSWARWIGNVTSNRNLVVVPNPVEVPRVDGLRDKDCASVLFLGLVNQEKGAYDLIEAVARVRDRHPSVLLLLGGDGDLTAAANRARQCGIESNIRLLGWVSGSQKEKLLSSAAVFCLPSYNEGLPMSILEAMAFGLPVVATPVGGVPEAITHGSEGFLVRPGDVATLADKLCAILDDPALAQAMGREARKKAQEKYSVERVMPGIERLYLALDASPRGS